MALAAEKMHMPIKRATAYRPMQLAKVEAYGNEDEEFCYFEPYLNKFLELNPGSKMYVRFDEQGHFIRCALAPAAALDFVQHCIPLFSVDMSHLYMKIKGQLALATAIDGNRQIMPV